MSGVTTTANIVLEGENLTRRIAGREIVAGVTLALEAGESVSLVGPSGCGKTSLLQVLGLLDRPDGGSVRVVSGGMDRGDAWSVSERQRARTRLEHIGFVFQQHNLFEAMTAIENVALPAWRKTGSRSIATKRATELLEQLGLARVAHSRAAELSGGEAQRTAIARAIINDPKVILADEPTGNLDSASSKIVMEMLYGVCERGAALLVVTHDLEVAARASRRIGMLDGSIVRPSQAPPSLSFRGGPL